MATSSADFSKILEPGLRKVYFETYSERPEVYRQVYHVDKSNKATETDFHIGAVGAWPEKGAQDSISYADITAGDDVTYTHVEYARGFQVERKLYDDEMYNVMDKRAAALARGGRARVETAAAKVLNDGFATNGYDAVPLFSNSHPYRVTGAATGDNLIGALALGEANLKTARTLMRSQKDEAEVVIEALGKKLVVPQDLEWTAMELTKSDGRTGSADNDSNVHKGMSFVVWDYLTDTSNWFLQDPDLHELWFFWRVRPEFTSEFDFDTKVAKYAGYMRFISGYSDWRGIVGANPA